MSNISRGPLQTLENHWHFQPIGEDQCEVDFRVAFEFRNRLLEKIIGSQFRRAMEKMVTAFEERATALYGSGV